MPVSRKTEIQATKKVMAVIGVFFCCNICMAITGTITQNISITSNSRVILADITDVLLVLHCCLNVIIYGIFDPKFRRIFFELFLLIRIIPYGIRKFINKTIFCQNASLCNARSNATNPTSLFGACCFYKKPLGKHISRNSQL